MSSTTDGLELKKKAMPLLRAVLTAKAKVGIPLHMLCREFEETCMEPLKFREMGYGSLERFLRDCSDICNVTPSSEGHLVVKGIASKEDAHIYKLVSGQRKDRKKKNKRVILAVKRRAAHFTGGKTPNLKPSLRYNHLFLPPQPGLFGNQSTGYKPFINTLHPTNHNYTQLRQAPFSRCNNEIAPRFQKGRQNNNKRFISKVQSQINRDPSMTIYQNNESTEIKNPSHSAAEPSKKLNKAGKNLSNCI